MKSKIIAITLIAGCSVLALGGATGGTNSGRAAFEKRCSGCHALDRDKVGPRLGGVVGRKAGAVSAFVYSDAMKRSTVVWNEASLNRWLTDPESVIPDNDMSFRLDDAGERGAIIAYLQEVGK
jgi:cytochrome c